MLFLFCNHNYSWISQSGSVKIWCDFQSRLDRCWCSDGKVHQEDRSANEPEHSRIQAQDDPEPKHISASWNRNFDGCSDLKLQRFMFKFVVKRVGLRIWQQPELDKFYKVGDRIKI